MTKATLTTVTYNGKAIDTVLEGLDWTQLSVKEIDTTVIKNTWPIEVNFDVLETETFDGGFACRVKFEDGRTGTITIEVDKEPAQEDE